MCDAYPGYCLAMSVIQIPLSLCPAAATLDMCNALRQTVHPSLLTNGQQANSCSRASAPAPASRALSSNYRRPPPPWMGPWYASDGCRETYFDSMC